MQATSDLYKQILADPNHKAETRLAVGKKDTAIENLETFFFESDLYSLITSKKAFSGDSGCLGVGYCNVGTIDVEMKMPTAKLPRQAKLVPQVRIYDTLGNYSEWISKGVFYVDTRDESGEGKNTKRLLLSGYDDLMKTEQDYPKSTLKWPARDNKVVQEIAEYIGVEIDPRTVLDLEVGFMVQYPGEYTCRETLGYIAAMHGGCFAMNDIGQLRLIKLSDMILTKQVLSTVFPDRNRLPILFGGEMISV